MMKKLLLLLFVTFFTLSVGYPLSSIASAAENQSPQVIITSLRVNSTKEFIEISNVSSEKVNVNGWKVTYTNASGGNLKTLTTLNFDMDVNSSFVFASADYITLHPDQTNLLTLSYSGMADSGGYVRLYKKVDISTEFPDGYELLQTVGWSTVASTNPDVAELTGTNSLKRCSDLMGKYRAEKGIMDFVQVSTDLLFMDGPLCSDITIPEVIVPNDPLPVPDPDQNTTPPSETPASDPIPIPTETTPVEDPVVVNPDSLPESVINTCDGVVINEIYANPPGDDTDKEFIELFNNNYQDISLNGCYIEINTSTKNKLLLDENVVPGRSYLLLTSFSLSFVLPNGTGGTLTLVDNATEIQSVLYPQDMSDDQSWAYDGADFKTTFMLTPGSQNIIKPLKDCDQGYIRNIETGRCNKEDEPKKSLICDTGYFLNTETNRCNKQVSSNVANECPTGQTRNPETNRCRSIISASVLVPCAVGQERNPDTNRCRSVELATSTLTACKEGQERNPDTNRCRTVVMGTASTGESIPVVMDVEAPSTTISTFIGLLFVAALALAYALYEWRSEVTAHIKRIFENSKLFKFMNKS